MNVLSLFDGMSCGQQALDRLGVKVDNYFASEIDKYAIQVTMANYPNTKQLGSVVNVDGYSLPKIDLLLGGSPCQSFSFAGKRKGMATKDEQEILTLEHYLQLKEEGFEFEGQSYLFWEYMRLLNECKPTYFLLENVEMGEKWEKVLSKAIGVNGIHINSALVSAQNRKRIYWTNIGMQPSGLFGDLESIIEQPKDRGILLKDVLETEVDEKYFLSEISTKKILKYNNSERSLNNDGKSICLQAGYSKIGHDNQFVVNKQFTGLDLNAKSRTIRNGGSATATDKHNWDLIVHNTMPRSSTSGKGGTGPLSRADGKTYCLDTGNTNAVEIVSTIKHKYNGDVVENTSGKVGTITQHMSRSGMTNGFKVVVPNTNAVEVREVKQINTNNKSNGGTQPYQQDRIYDIDGISPALNTDGRGHAVEVVLTSKNKKLQKIVDNNIFIDKEVAHLDTYNQKIDKDKSPALTLPHNTKFLYSNSRIRRLTPIECERLQTVADNYTNHVSDSQRYKMLGNGWTIDVIAHILKYAF